MLEFIINIDHSLFYFFNTTIANALFDKVMPFLTNQHNWTLVYIFLFGWLLWKGGKKGRICALLLVLTIIFTDQLSSSLIKHLFERLRPCHTLDNVRLLIPCGVGKSFPSSHAANNFAAALILAYFYRNYLWVYIVTAFLVAFSRIYVGVHYPFDVLGGALVGSGVALLVLFIYIKIEDKFFSKNENIDISEN